MDVHDLKRPQGADVADYVRAGASGAAEGARWCRRGQLLGLLGWDQMVGGPLWRAFADNVTADPSSTATSTNTATAATLEVLYGLTPDQGQLAVAGRAAAPYGELEDLGPHGRHGVA